MPQRDSEIVNTTPDREQSAKALAEKHFEIESGLTHIFHATSQAESFGNGAEPIKLLEVNENTPASGIMPLQFGPAPASGVFYPSVVIEVTPDEFRRIERHELQLPTGWDRLEELPKPVPVRSGYQVARF